MHACMVHIGQNCGSLANADSVDDNYCDRIKDPLECDISINLWFSHHRDCKMSLLLTENIAIATIDHRQFDSTSLPHKPPFGMTICSCNFHLFSCVETCV